MIVIPSKLGQIRIELQRLGTPGQWRGPAVFIASGHLPLVSVEIINGAIVVDVIGHDPTAFAKLPQVVRDAAAFWQAELPAIAARWDAFTRPAGALAPLVFDFDQAS